MSIKLNDYHYYDFYSFNRGSNGRLLKQDLENKKRDIIEYLERQMLGVYPNQVLLEFIDNTKIEFSSEIKEMSYVKNYKEYVIGLLKAALNGICKQECKLNILVKKLIKALEELSSENLINGHLSEEIQYLIEEIRRYPYRCEFKKQCNDNECHHQCCRETGCCCIKINSIISKYICEPCFPASLVAGEYYFGTNKIVLYLEVIKDCADDYIESVFAHELFHAYHMKSVELSGGKWLNKRKYEVDVVLESLAASFEYFYTKDVMGNAASSGAAYASWKQSDVAFWPYSGAKGIVDMNEIKVVADRSSVYMAQPFLLVFSDSLLESEEGAHGDIMTLLRLFQKRITNDLESIRSKYWGPEYSIHQFVTVRFEAGGKTYDYLCDGYWIVPGDKVIIKSRSGNVELEAEAVFSEKGIDHMRRSRIGDFKKYSSIVGKS